MNKTYLLIGGNLGLRYRNLQKARELIAEKIGGILEASSIYETAAWGIESQPDFLNQVLEVVTELPPMELLKEIHVIEELLDRKRFRKWGARTIDIDILYYENQIIHYNLIATPFRSFNRSTFGHGTLQRHATTKCWSSWNEWSSHSN